VYPAEFDYYRADTVEGALDLLADNPGAELLAGGHSLIPTMKTGLSSPEALVDMGGIDSLQSVEHDAEAGVTRIGAMATYSTVTDDEACWESIPVVAEATQAIGDKQVRNRGTVGGNIAHADPASDLPAAVLAADATVHARSPDGERTIPIEDFFLGMYATALDEEEILTAIEIPHHGDAGAAYEKRPSPSSGYALVGVAAVLDVEDGEIDSARVAANGVMDHGVRLDPVEAALEGAAPKAEVLAEAAERAADDLDEVMMMDDLQASSEFRAQLLTVHTRDALEAAADRA